MTPKRIKQLRDYEKTDKSNFLTECLDEIEKLQERQSAENLYKIFSESFQVNEYRSVWQGEWPELQFYIHEVWKRDPVVTKLEEHKQILIEALNQVSSWVENMTKEEEQFINNALVKVDHISETPKEEIKHFVDNFLDAQELKIKESAQDLLCLIHRDGGHYINDHGLEKAFKDAEEILYDWREAYDNRPQEIVYVKIRKEN